MKKVSLLHEETASIKEEDEVKNYQHEGRG